MSALYVVVCRLLAFVVLLGRKDRAKELEILVLPTNSRFFAARSAVRALRCTTECCWRRSAGCFRHLVGSLHPRVVWSIETRHEMCKS